jgi:hypothetical protein
MQPFVALVALAMLPIACGGQGGSTTAPDSGPEPSDTSISDSGPEPSDTSITDAGPDATLDAGVCAGWAPPAQAERQRSLDGSWHLLVRKRVAGAAWGSPLHDGPVQVPGSFYLGREDEELEFQLAFSRRLELPAAWACAPALGFHALAEFDSVDYWATVALDGEVLGRHTGYLGRFAVDLGARVSGELQVEASDLRQKMAGVHDASDIANATTPRRTVQAVEPSNWGMNVAGILESTRLRLVGPLYLRNAFAATLEAGSPATVRVGAELVALAAGPLEAEVRYELLGPTGAVVAEGDFVVAAPTLAAGEAHAAVADVAVPSLGEATRVRVTVAVAGTVSDLREEAFVRRRVAVQENRLLVDGAPEFAGGPGAYVTARALPLDTLDRAADFTGYVADAALLATRSDALGAAVRQTHARWLRLAHFVPVRLVHERLAASGLLLYQDFPLTWLVDWDALDEAEILAQLEEFVWRVSAQPAVAVVALHNEPEVDQTDPRRLQRAQRLIEQMIARTRQLAPQLVVIGSSGGAGTAAFPGDKGYPVDDDLLDVHRYLNSVWNSLFGYRQIPEAIAELAARGGGRPVLWSEGGAAYDTHLGYLMLLTDEIEPANPPQAAAVRASIEGTLIFAGQRLSLREFYAGVSCLFHEGVSRSDLPAVQACIAGHVAARDDRLLIERAQDFFFAHRVRALAPPDANPVVTWRRVVADWLATQFFEARIQWLQGGDLVGYLPWDQAQLGYPMDLLPVTELFAQFADGTDCRSDTRAIIAAAHAPRAVYVRTLVAGTGAEVLLLNSGVAAEATLKVEVGGVERTAIAQTIAASSVTTLTLSAASLAPLRGEVVELRLELPDGAPTSYRIYVP